MRQQLKANSQAHLCKQGAPQLMFLTLDVCTDLLDILDYSLSN